MAMRSPPRFFAALLALCLLVATAQAAPVGTPERRTALVIGNGAYASAPLKNPVNDARDMAAALKSLGFEVTLLTDASHKQMEAAARDFGLKLRQGGAGLFYFAGHGLQVAGENYLVPVDAVIQTESDVKFGCLNAGLVLGKMEDARNGLNMVILDACRNNPFARSFRSAELGLAKMDAPTGSIIAYATAPGSVAADGAGRNGVYTEHLLKNMRAPGLAVTDLFMRVRMGVVADTGKKQVPWEASSLTGYFYFNGEVGPGQAQQQPTALAAPVPTDAAPTARPAPAMDLKAEKKRLAEEAARLKREKQELAQVQSIQAERERQEAERQKLEQAKLLAMSARPKQAPASSTPAAPQANAHATQFAQLARAGLPDARAYFERTVQAHPDDADARAGLAIALVFTGHEADARYHIQRLGESGVLTARVRAARGLMLGMEGNADSDYQLNRAQEEGVDPALLALCRASVALRRNDFTGGRRAMDAYAAQTPPQEQGAYAKALAEGLTPANRVVGTYFWSTGGTVSSTYLIIERSGDGLKGTDGGGEYKSTITNMALQGLSLSFLMEYDLGFFLGGKGSSHCVADFSKNLNQVPITCRDANYGNMSSLLVRKEGGRN
ncbi:MAG: caspase family protein [Proteobacteria bacterium]|nr:caspase family protein [Pseudomonadota bacterium]MBU1595117.1 caspase family protein [Pseudomonadota bacterium]